MLAWLALMCFPLSALALYFVVAATLGSGPISPRGKFTLMLAALITLTAMCVASWIGPRVMGW